MKCELNGVFSIGVAKSESSIAGAMKRNAPRIALERLGEKARPFSFASATGRVARQQNVV
jgi:hypothetical protein